MFDIVSFLVQAIRLSAIFLFGSTGEILTEKSGHLNLGIPGIMCMGALGGCYGESLYISSLPVSASTSAPDLTLMNPFLAVLIPILTAILFAGAMGALYSFLAVTLRANQNVTGLTITTFGIGVTKFFIAPIKSQYQAGFSQASIFFRTGFPFASSLGDFGSLFFSYGCLVYLAIIVAVVASLILSKTRVGLHLRAVGENPATADAAGINVGGYRYVATIIGSAIAGLGGLTFVMDWLSGSWEYSIDGMGWLSVALVIFAMWKPNLSILGSILFAILYILPNYIPGIGFVARELMNMVPYFVTVLVLLFVSFQKKRENQPPASLGLSYFREAR